MRALSALATRVMGALVRRRDRLPRFANRIIDSVAKNPDGPLGRLASALTGGAGGAGAPAPTTAPATEVRVYIGPTNYAGQGFLWAGALTASSPSIGAVNMAVELPGGFAFPATTLVPVGAYQGSRVWQEAELAAVEGFTHVLFEAERPLFGSLFARDVAAEIDALTSRGASCAFLCHGTDIRSPRDHMARHRWSPYFDDAAQTRLLQADADQNLALVRSQHLPIFVSTPDLLIDVPEAVWCPVVIDVERWSGGRALGSSRPPVVLHIPSKGATKGTALIEPTLKKMNAAGVIEYRSVTGVAWERMPALVADADIVLDQFRLGSYGVAACEAMAAGRVVVGSVEPAVRTAVESATGLALPIVEADPDTLEGVLLGLIDSPDAMASAGSAGTTFVSAVHSGVMSAHALRTHWIDKR